MANMATAEITRPAQSTSWVIYGVPWHVCPTVALHSEVVVVTENAASARWPVTARARKLTV